MIGHDFYTYLFDFAAICTNPIKKKELVTGKIVVAFSNCYKRIKNDMTGS